MGEQITVEKLSTISTYGESIKSFSSAVRTASEETYRKFGLKAGVDNAKGQAYQAFLEKVNALQNQVFVGYPDALDKVASGYSDYSSSLKGSGFNERVWSDTDGAQSVKAILTGEITTNLKEKQRKLQAALDDATDLLGIEAEDVSKSADAATNALEESGVLRVTTASSVDTAFTSFKTSLSSSSSEMATLLSQLNQLESQLLVTPNAIIRAIKEGRLTEERVSYLDLVKSKEDATALDTHLRGDYEAFFKVDPDKVNQNIYNAVTFDMVDLMTNGDDAAKAKLLNGLENGLTVLISIDPEKEAAHLAKLLNSSDGLINKYLLTTQLMIEYGVSEDNPTLQRYLTTGTNTYYLRNLWNYFVESGLRGNSLATATDPYRPPSTGSIDLLQKNLISGLHFDSKNGFEFDIRWIRYSSVPDNSAPSGLRAVDIYETFSDKKGSHAHVKVEGVLTEDMYKNLEAAHIEQLKESVKDKRDEFENGMIISSMSMISPEVSMLLEGLSQVSEYSGDDLIDRGVQVGTLGQILGELSGREKFGTITEKATSIMTSYKDYLSAIESLNEETAKAFNVEIGYGGVKTSGSYGENGMFERAGHNIDSNRSLISLKINPFNYQGYRRYLDLEQGILSSSKVGYTGKLSLQDALDEVRADNPSLNDQKVLDYLEKGKKSGYSIKDLDYPSYIDILDDLKEKGITLP